MAICLRPIVAGDTERCAAIAVRAFQEDPFFQAVSGRGGKGYPLLMAFLVRVWLGSQRGLAAEEDGAILGFAVFSAGEDAAIRVGECVQMGAGQVVLACGIRGLLAFLRASARFSRVWDGQSQTAHYLTLLAVDPDCQGRGIGTALLREGVLPRVMEKGANALCLNTNKEKNRAFYRKNHFEEIGSSSLPVGGRTVSNWSFRMELPKES